MKSWVKSLHLGLHSLRFRLVFWFVLVLALVLTGFGGVMYVREIHDLRTLAYSRLAYRSQRLLGWLRGAEPGIPTDGLIALAANARFERVPLIDESDVLALIASDGSIVQSWGPVDGGALGAVAEELVGPFGQERFPGPRFLERHVVVSSGIGGRVYVFTSTPLRMAETPLGYLLIGSPFDPDGRLPRLGLTLGLGVFLTLAVAAIGGVMLVDRALWPVRQITYTARTLSETDLSRRLKLKRKDELGELADTFDQMLSRLEAAFERQRRFTADASHELRTPLTIVELEAGQALEARRQPEEYERVLKVIRAENQFMIRLVNNLLTLARMDAGQTVLNCQPLDLSDVVLEVMERLAPLAARQGVELSGGDLPPLSLAGDRQYLTQMFANLVENAIKYAGAGKERPAVRVESGMRDQGGRRMIWVRVIDNGPGIAPEHLPHIFERFYRADRSRTRVAEGVTADYGWGASSGTGLGLAIAQWIARAHRGEIRVDSRPGEGAIFEVCLPQSEPALPFREPQGGRRQ